MVTEKKGGIQQKLKIQNYLDKTPLQNRFKSFKQSFGRKNALFLAVLQPADNETVIKTPYFPMAKQSLFKWQIESVLGTNRVCLPLKKTLFTTQKQYLHHLRTVFFVSENSILAPQEQYLCQPRTKKSGNLPQFLHLDSSITRFRSVKFWYFFPTNSRPHRQHGTHRFFQVSGKYY